VIEVGYLSVGFEEEGVVPLVGFEHLEVGQHRQKGHCLLRCQLVHRLKQTQDTDTTRQDKTRQCNELSYPKVQSVGAQSLTKGDFRVAKSGGQLDLMA